MYLDPEEAERVLNDIRIKKKGFASKRSENYLAVRRSLEATARELFILKGGKPIRNNPHYMTVGECPWLLEWFERGKMLRMPIEAFDSCSVSFTYGGFVSNNEIGLPQEWNSLGISGSEKYIEVQVWDDKPLTQWLGGTS